MSLVKGLAAIQKKVDATSKDYEDGPKAKWVSLKDGQSVRINFLQEFDENADNFDPKAGALVVAVEHAAPHNYRRKAQCTGDDGAPCVGCEMNKKFPKKGWQQKLRLYVNVLVDDGNNDPYVAILSQGIGGKSITPVLTELAKEYEGITTTQFKIKRTGSEMNNTSYSLFPLPNGKIVDAADYELYDLEKTATRVIEYEKQAEFYEIEDKDVESSEALDSTSW